MKKLGLFLALLAMPSLLAAQVSNVRIVGRTASDASGYDVPVLVTADGKLQINATLTGAGTSCTATTSAPSYSNGSSNGLNCALDGSLRVTTNPHAVTQPDTINSATINSATLNAAYTLSPANGQSTASFEVTGLTGTGATLTIEVSNAGVGWVAAGATFAGSNLTAQTLTTDGQFRVNASGRRGIRLRVSTAGTGTITVGSTLSIAPYDSPNPSRDSNGDLRAPRYTLTPYRVSVSANTSTTLLAISSARAGFDIQCNGTAIVAVSRTGATITSADPTVSGSYDLIVPAGTTPYYVPSAASRTQAVTVYTSTAQACWGVSYIEQ